MYRIDNATAATTLPVQKPPGTPGFFSTGTIGGQMATIGRGRLGEQRAACTVTW
jgi:hypothetical protein